MAKKAAAKKASGRQALAKGAEAIRKAQQGTAAGGKSAKNKKAKPGQVTPVSAAAPAKVEIPKLTRDVSDIIRDRVTILPGSIGLAIHEDTPLEESLAILDYVETMQDHVGFMVGDVVNFSQAKFGDKYTAAMNQTGRAKSTLKAYAEVSRKIPPDQRAQALSYSHHREIIRLENPEKRALVLKEAGEAAAKGKLPSVKELRFKVQRLQPKKAKANVNRRAGKGKGKKGESKGVKPAYKPTPEEQSQIDAALSTVEEARAAILDSDLQKLILKVDTATKKEWSKALEPFEKFRFQIDKATGY